MRRGLLTIRTLVAKLTGIVFAIGAGVIAGKEGPFVHGGGIVGGGIGGMGSMCAPQLSAPLLEFNLLCPLAQGMWAAALAA